MGFLRRVHGTTQGRTEVRWCWVAIEITRRDHSTATRVRCLYILSRDPYLSFVVPEIACNGTRTITMAPRARKKFGASCSNLRPFRKCNCIEEKLATLLGPFGATQSSGARGIVRLFPPSLHPWFDTLRPSALLLQLNFRILGWFNLLAALGITEWLATWVRQLYQGNCLQGKNPRQSPTFHL